MMIAIINPFRYRSYYYDRETNLYYLNSRYYNPEWGRFINAHGIINGNTDIIGHNLYAYCSNNPVGNMDSEGIFFSKIISVVSKAYKMIKTAVAVTSNIYLRTKKQDLSADMLLDDLIIKKITNEVLYDSINKLNEKDRMRIIMYYFNDMTLQEIAKLENISHQAVSKSIKKSLIELKRIINEGI